MNRTFPEVVFLFEGSLKDHRNRRCSGELFYIRIEDTFNHNDSIVKFGQNISLKRYDCSHYVSSKDTKWVQTSGNNALRCEKWTLEKAI